MNLSAPFVRRPIATTLLTAGLALAGVGAYFVLPVSPLPQVDFPTIQVSAQLPGASPETMATSVATPLERHLGVIADVIEMTSRSQVGQSQITLQFQLNRDINGAARDVQAAINAARVDLPATLRSNPTYRKVNPAESPIMILALTSQTKTPGQIYDEVSNIVQQRLLQVSGVGDVEVGGASLPAVRVEIVPFALSRYGISLEDVRAALNAANPNRPKGVIEDDTLRYQIYTNDTGRSAANYRDLVIAWRNGAAVRLRDVAAVIDGVEDVHTVGLFNGQPAVIVILTRQPNANIIETVDSVKAILPQLRADLPRDVNVAVASDRTVTIRASLREVETTLLIALLLVVLVVSVFLSSVRATFIPAVAVVSSLCGTLGIMYLAGFSLNNLSLMALTVATGFVVDDAIVVLENVSRHIETGMPRWRAAMLGTREVGFTVLSISISLVAVFIPLLFMGGIVGRLFREFAVTLSAAVLISLVISLTTTAMMCAFVLTPERTPKPPNRLVRWSQRLFERTLGYYGRALDWSLDHGPAMLGLLFGVIALNVYLYVVAPKGFFPQQDTGQLNCGMRADQSISFALMEEKLKTVIGIVSRDPAVATAVGFTGGTRAGGGFMFISLKPSSERHEGSQAVIARLRPQLDRVAGLRLFLNPVQDMQIGGRQANSTYQYTLQSDSLPELRLWASRLAEQIKLDPAVTDVDSDQEDHGVQSFVDIDRPTAARLGIAAINIDNVLYDAFGQRLASTIYTALNQYHVVMEVDPRYAREPRALNDIYVPSGGYAIPAGGLAATPSGGISTAAAGTTAPAGAGAATAPQAGATSTASAAGGSLSSPGVSSAASSTSSSSTATSGGSSLSQPAGGSALSSSATTTSGLSSLSASGGSFSTSSSASGSGSASSSSVPATPVTPTTAGLGATGMPGSGSGSGGGGAGSGAAATPASAAPAAPLLPLRDASNGNAVSVTADNMVPLAAIAHFADSATPTSVNHQNTSLATTIAFNLAAGYSLSDAAVAFAEAENQIHLPASVHGSFQGTARTFQSSVGDEPVLIAAALLTIYIVLGILYESYVHPLTVLSTLPSAGVGAVLALLLFNMEFSIIALIGVILLIGIVKKNAILIIDFALDAERARSLSSRAAIREACMLRFRPILMTTLAAALGALPLAVGFGEGAELRRPLGVSIVGGLLVSQLLTLFTTPVVYLYVDRLRRPEGDERYLSRAPATPAPEPT
jgi:multidrug efflux pump